MNISLTTTNVQQYYEQLHASILQESTIVFVHAHWCPFTVQFYPIWRALKKTLYGNTSLRIYEIDDGAIGWIRQNKKQLFQRIAEQFQPDSQYKIFFPTVLMYVNGKRHKFTGERTQESIALWINKLLLKSQTRTRSRATLLRTRSTTKIQTPKQTRSPKQSLKDNIDKAFKKLLLK